MVSLGQLLATHAPLLVVDAASSRIQVGFYRGATSRWESSDEEAGIGIFRCVERLKINLAELEGFVFCDGPGSILGIRTSAMALRTWNLLRRRPLYAYSSLALVAEALGRREIGVVADARRETWHHFRLGEGLTRRAASELTGALVMPENFRHWSAFPTGVQRVPYVVPELLQQTLTAELFRPTDAPDAFLHEEPSYVTWTPQIHRAPA